MQTHPLKLTMAAPATSINIEGRAFRYITGISAGDARIIVKPENGNEMELRPGQGFKLSGEIGRWFVKSFDGVSDITGTLNIGSGDFEDNNVSIAGGLSIANQPTVNLAAGSKVQEELVAYSGSYSANTALTANTAVNIVPAANNVNGIIVQKQFIENENSTTLAFIAKATAPASVVDGDVLCISDKAAGAAGYYVRDTSKIKIPAGRGLWVIADVGTSLRRSVTYTVL